MKHTTHNTKSGFTLLFSILVATMVVSIGATIISIAIRQTILSGTSRESQYAFYAANTVLECAHYWDTANRTELGGKSVFPAPGVTPAEILIISSDSESSSVTCSGVNIITGAENDGKGIERDGSENSNEATFYLKIKNQVPSLSTAFPEYTYCAEATVKKTNDSGTIKTTIEAKGYNTCDTTNVRRVERGLIQYYES
jgi:Tfp pilus assembly protein PilE